MNEVRDIPRAQDQLFDRRGSRRARNTRRSWSGSRAGARSSNTSSFTLLSQNIAGALGFALRKTLFPWLLGACGRNVIFGQNVVLRHPHKIRIGDNVVIDDNCLLDAKGDSNRGITIGSGVFVGRNTILSCKNGDIELADGANIGFNCEIFSASRVRIGREHAAGRVLLPDWRRPRLQRSVGSRSWRRDDDRSGVCDRRRAPGLARARRFSTA